MSNATAYDLEQVDIVKRYCDTILGLEAYKEYSAASGDVAPLTLMYEGWILDSLGKHLVGIRAQKGVVLRGEYKSSDVDIIIYEGDAKYSDHRAAGVEASNVVYLVEVSRSSKFIVAKHEEKMERLGRFCSNIASVAYFGTTNDSADWEKRGVKLFVLSEGTRSKPDVPVKPIVGQLERLITEIKTAKMNRSKSQVTSNTYAL